MYALASCCTGFPRSSRRNVAGCGELRIINRLQRSGRIIAKFHATAPPQSCATSRSMGAPGTLSGAPPGPRVTRSMSATMSCTSARA